MLDFEKQETMKI